MTNQRALIYQLDWYRLQAANLDNPEDERALWQQLADELEHWLYTGSTQDESLF